MQVVKGISPNEEKQIAIYQIKEDGIVKYYCEKGYKQMNKDELKEIKSKPRSYTHLMIPVDKDYKNSLTLKEQYKAFIEEADYLKQLTEGRINLYKTGSVGKTALQLFY